MKKISYILIRVYQIVLISIFIFSFIEAMKLGNESAVAKGDYAEIRDDWDSPDIVHGVSIRSGYVGGALGMSIISASCLFLISFMELRLYQQNFKDGN
jgi:hypothetical protein